MLKRQRLLQHIILSVGRTTAIPVYEIATENPQTHHTHAYRHTNVHIYTPSLQRTWANSAFMLEENIFLYTEQKIKVFKTCCLYYIYAANFLSNVFLFKIFFQPTFVMGFLLIRMKTIWLKYYSMIWLSKWLLIFLLTSLKPQEKLAELLMNT